jgi:hypothetical protein
MRASVLVLVSLVGLGGCARRSLEAYAVQTRPSRAVDKPDELPVSEPLFIHTRDMDLPRDFLLRSSAQFAIVSRDRVRFHLGIVRQDESEADVKAWKVHLEDEAGRTVPIARELVVMRRFALNWRLFPYEPNSSWCREPPCLSRDDTGLEAFEGRADYVLAGPDILAKYKKLVLVARRGGQEMRFSWTFGEDFEVHHHGYTLADKELGTILVPGPHVEEAHRENDTASWETVRPEH